MDIHFVHEAMEDPLVRGFLAKLEHDEIIPIVPPVPDTDPRGLFPADRAPLRQSQDRRHHPPALPRRLQPPAEIHPPDRSPTACSAGQGVAGLALVSALWCRYCSGTTDSGAVIEPNDPNWDRLQATAKAAKDDPAAWLAMDDIYGEVGRVDGLRRALSPHALKTLWATARAQTLKRYLAGKLCGVASPAGGAWVCRRASTALSAP